MRRAWILLATLPLVLYACSDANEGQPPIVPLPDFPVHDQGVDVVGADLPDELDTPGPTDDLGNDLLPWTDCCDDPDIPVVPDVPPDPCEPNPCTGVADECLGYQLVSYAATGTCEVVEGLAECAYQYSVVDDCGAKAMDCQDGACTAAPALCDYEFSNRASYVHGIAVGGVGGEEDCCFDFHGDGPIDNALGELLGGIAQLVGAGELNQLLADEIAAGTVVILLEWEGLESAAADIAVGISGYYGVTVDALGNPIASLSASDYANNVAGQGRFEVFDASFKSGVGVPLIHLPGGTIEDGLLTAGPGVFELSLPILGKVIEAHVGGARLEAEVAMHPNGKGLMFVDGKLGGYVSMADLFAALNTFVVDECPCLNLTGPLVFYTDDTEPPTCDPVPDAACNPDDYYQGPCHTLGQVCSVALPLIQADVDTDGNEHQDALSIGVWLDATAAELVGIDSCL